MTYGLLNTSDPLRDSLWIDQQEAFITSLRSQRLVVVLRPSNNLRDISWSQSTLFSLIRSLHKAGLKHLEIAWSSDPNWCDLIREIQQSFQGFSLGAASIVTYEALEAVKEVGLSYAMTPVWDPDLQKKAKQLGQLLVPGVFSPTEILQAKNFGCRVVKLFPASTLGIHYIHQVQPPINSLPFISILEPD